MVNNDNNNGKLWLYNGYNNGNNNGYNDYNITHIP